MLSAVSAYNPCFEAMNFILCQNMSFFKANSPQMSKNIKIYGILSPLYACQGQGDFTQSQHVRLRFSNAVKGPTSHSYRSINSRLCDMSV